MKGLIVTFAVFLLGTLGGLISPFWGVVSYWAVSTLYPIELWFWSVPPINYAFYIGICTLIGWTLRGFGSWTGSRAVRPVLLATILFLAASWLSVAASAWQKDAADAALVYSKDLLMVVVAVSLVDSFRRLRILTWVVLLSVGYLAFDMNVSYYSGWNRLHENGFAGIDNNGMAMLLAMGVPVSLAMGNYEKNWKMKALAWAWIPFEVNSVFFAFSRSAMLGMALAGVVLVWLMPKSRLKPVLLVLGLIGGLALAGNEVRDRFSTTFKEREELDTSAMSRYDTWSAAWSCIMDHPLLGLGPRCFNKVSRQYGLSDGKSVHNLFLQVGADSGIAAAASLLGMFVTAIIIMIRRRKPAAEAHPWFPHWTAMITAGLVSCLVSSQFIGMEQISLPYFFIGLGMMAIRLAAKRFPDAQTVGGGKTHDHRRPTGASISAPRASEGL